MNLSLSDKIKALRSGCDPKSNIDYYGMICFRNGQAMASDGTNTIIVRTDLKVNCCVDADKLHRIVKSFKEDPTSVTIEGTELVIRYEDSVFKLPTADADIFPELDRFHVSNTYHSGKGIVSAIRRAMFCAEPEIEHNPICGIYIAPVGVMSTNRKEVICVRLEEKVKSAFRITYSAAKLVAKQKEDPIQLFTIGNTLGFKFEDMTLLTRALQGDFPENLLLPVVTGPDKCVQFFEFPESVEPALRAFNSIATDKSFNVTLYYDSTGMSVSLDGDITAKTQLSSTPVTQASSVSVRGDRLLAAAKTLTPEEALIQDNFLQLRSQDCIYSLGRVS